jgi:hypothetical protein
VPGAPGPSRGHDGDHAAARVRAAGQQLFGIPDELSTAAFIVAGYPARPSPTKLNRLPVEAIAFLDDIAHPLTPNR